jgi:hypothetical protein
MTEQVPQPEPIDPPEDPAGDPPVDGKAKDAVDRAEAVDEPNRQLEPPPDEWIGSDVP